MLPLLLQAALAGSGPWTLAPGTYGVYVGVKATLTPVGDGEVGPTADVSGVVQTAGAVAVMTVEALRGIDLELGGGIYHINTTEPGAGLCGELGIGTWDPVMGCGLRCRLVGGAQ